MDNSRGKFEKELNGFLKRYFNDDELSWLNLDNPCISNNPCLINRWGGLLLDNR